MKIQDLENKLIEETDKIKKANQLSGKPHKQLNDNDLYRIIINACDIVIIDYSSENDLSNYTYAIYNPEIDAYVRDREYLGFLVQYIINSETVSPNISSKNAIANIEESIKFSKRSIRKANLPPKNLIKFQNCIYDLKNHQSYQFDDEEVKNYDFINTIRYPLISLDDVNQEMLKIVHNVLEGGNVLKQAMDIIDKGE